MTVNYIDIVLVAFFALFIIEGYRRGLLVSLIGLLRIFVSVPLALFVSRNYTDFIYDSYVKSYVVHRVSIAIDNAGGTGAFIDKIIDEGNPLLGSLSKGIEALPFNSVSSLEAAQIITDKFLQPAVITALKLIVFIAVIFIVYLITAIVMIVLKHHSKKKDTPLKTANKLLGALFGAAKGATVIVVICAIAGVALSLKISDNSSFLNSVEESSVINFINSENPYMSF